MPVYMLDTDISSYVMKRSNDAVLIKLRGIPPEAVCISAITKSELQYGVEISSRQAKDQAALQDYLTYVEVLDYPGEAALDHAQIRAHLKSSGKMIGTNDLLIAAHARALGLTLVTNNTLEFNRVSGLKIENWVKPVS